VGAEHALAPDRASSDLPDRNRRRVRRQHRVSRDQRAERREDLLLDREDLGPGLDHELGAVDGILEPARDLDPSQDVLAVAAELSHAGPDPLPGEVDRPGRRVVQSDPNPAGREHLGDPRAHHTRPDHGRPGRAHAAV